jgi:hypothetical protein
MRRLSELQAEDRLSSRAHALIRAMGATVQSEERLLRVRRLLDAPGLAAAPRLGWRIGPALGLLGVSAAAAAGSSAMSSALDIDQTAEGRTLVAPLSIWTEPARVARPAALPAGQVVKAAPSREPAAPLTPAPALPSRPAALPLSDVGRVHEAAKALRRDRDAERALRLLEHGAPVSGPLAEEALALRIEASLALVDGRQAKLATAYLTHYPRGRYRELARKALARSGQ